MKKRVGFIMGLMLSVPALAESHADAQAVGSFLRALSTNCDACTTVGKDLMVLQESECEVAKTVANYKILLSSPLFYLGYAAYESDPGAYEQFLDSAKAHAVCDDYSAWAKQAANVFSQG